MLCILLYVKQYGPINAIILYKSHCSTELCNFYDVTCIYRDPVDRPNQVNKISALKTNVTTLNFLRI